WDVSGWIGASSDSLVVIDSTTGKSVGSLINNRVGGSLTASASFVYHLQVGIEIPFVAFQNSDNIAGVPASTSLSHGGLADVRLSLKGTLMRTPRGPFDLGLLAAVTVPSATADFAGDKTLTFAPELLISRAIKKARIALNFGYLLRQPQSVNVVRF